MSDRPTVLVLRALGLGDLMTGLPALALLRRARPDARIVLAAPLEMGALAVQAGSVDAVVQAHELEPILDPPPRPELAIDLHGNGPESRALLRACSPRRLVAFGEGGIEWRADEHEVRRWCRLLVEGLPIATDAECSVVGALPVPAEVDAPIDRTLIHCGAKSAARRWPAERFAAVAARLSAEGHRVVVTGGRAEADLAAAIASAAGVEARTDLTLRELCAWVAAARLVICGDTGVAHVASNYATPSVVLFGPVSPAVWGPPADPRHQVLWRGDGTGDPHGAVPDPALLALSVDDVLDAVPRALATSNDRKARL